jgi:hypothetical protein
MNMNLIENVGSNCILLFKDISDPISKIKYVGNNFNEHTKFKDETKKSSDNQIFLGTSF